MITDKLVYLLGSNQNGQLGLPERGLLESPRLCNFGVNIISVACGNFHSLLLVEGGVIYAMEND
jgi:alpha-tubulin suppressor-like RCC1 family protein